MVLSNTDSNDIDPTFSECCRPASSNTSLQLLKDRKQGGMQNDSDNGHRGLDGLTGLLIGVSKQAAISICP
jgi:hypothetical protein